MNPSSAPPPPPPIAGALPAQRLKTQISSEPPACVQNAMMTKDKKPFTYTPGGIDLSQIKSPRMAKRVAMNANSPGVQSHPKVSPLAQHSTNGTSPAPSTPQTPTVARNGAPPPPPPPPAPAMGGLAMGMPFQVLPPGGIPQKNNKQLSPPQPSSSNNVQRKSPQAFDPPPMACRPEIKIPPNPMALLKQTPRPQQKDDYWVEEYVQQKKENSVPRDEPRRVVSPPAVAYQPPQSPPIAYQPAPPSPQPQQQRFVQQRSPSPPAQQLRSIQLDEPRVATPPAAPPSPQHQPAPTMNRVTSPTVSMTPIQPKSVIIEPMTPQQAYQQSQQNNNAAGRIILSTMPSRMQQQQVQNLGSLYIPPPMSFDDKQYLLNQQSPPWMSSKKPIETPEWVNRDEIDFAAAQLGRALPMQSREHVIPVAVEKSPMKTPNFAGPMPFYGTSQPFIGHNSVIAPKPDPNANQFVNQGYNDIDFSQPLTHPSMRPYMQQQQPQQQQPKVQQQQQQQPQYQPIPQQQGTRIIPIQVEGSQPQSHVVILQSDPNTPNSAGVRGNNQFFTAPNQSKSFRILQAVTGTMGEESDENEAEQRQMDQQPMVEQGAIYSRPLANENDRAYMKQMSRGAQAPYGHMYQQDEVDYQQQQQPHLYQGSSNPGRSFKVLQSMTQPENAGPGLSDL